VTGPRRLRTQLTMLYAVPFFLSSALLLVVPLLQTRDSVPVAASLRPDAPVPQEALFTRILVASAFGLMFMIGVAIILGWLVAGRFLRPLRTIISTAQNISASNLHRRVGSTGRNDEFNDLAATLDGVFERLERAFESQRQFVANASHELRTPLAAERTLLQVALADPETNVDTLRAVCQDVLELGAAQERLIDALLTLASGDQVVEVSEPVDLAELATRAIGAHTPGEAVHDPADPAPGTGTGLPVPLVTAEDGAGPGGIRIETELAPAPATGDSRLLASLVANLVDNAVRHNTPGGAVEVSTGLVDGRPAILVRNTGPVVPAAEIERLFQPFQRLDGQRTSYDGGHGLGLAIVRSIAHAHCAAIRTNPLPGGGLEILVRLPAPIVKETNGRAQAEETSRQSAG
jgi:signal transduction histidine kinase